MPKIPNVLVAYHTHCTDGLFAAANTHKALTKQGIDQISFHPINYRCGNDLGYKGDLLNFDAILFVDFCPDVSVLEHLLEKKDRMIVVLDHHATARDGVMAMDISGYLNFVVIFADQLSGTGLTHVLLDKIPSYIKRDVNLYGELHSVVKGENHIFHTNVKSLVNSEINVELDGLSRYVSARDLWQLGLDKDKGDIIDHWLKLTESSEIHPSTIYDKVESLGGIDELVKKYAIVDQTIHRLTKKAIMQSKHHRFECNGKPVNIIIGVPVPSYSSIFGAMGYGLKPDEPTIVVALGWDDRNEQVTLSMRSGKGIVVNGLAQSLFGGGGHPKASGAVMKTPCINYGELAMRLENWIRKNPSCFKD